MLHGLPEKRVETTASFFASITTVLVSVSKRERIHSTRAVPPAVLVGTVCLVLSGRARK